eukprot:8544946-Prorocentrum_lima.AAC.1
MSLANWLTSAKGGATTQVCWSWRKPRITSRCLTVLNNSRYMQFALSTSEHAMILMVYWCNP